MGERRVMIGRVKSVNPARRELRVGLVGGKSTLTDDVDRIYVVSAEGAEFCCRTKQIREHGDQWIVECSPGVLRDTVAQLRNGAVSIAADALRTREQMEFGGEELLGFFVDTVEGKRVGRVTAVIDSPAHDVLEIETADGGCMLAPLVEEMVDAIDWEGTIVRVRDLSAFAVHQDPDPTTRTV